VPHSAQNFACIGNDDPHEAHGRCCGAPHSRQNLAVGVTSPPHEMHCIPGTVGVPRSPGMGSDRLRVTFAPLSVAVQQ
jgi:hypothetical protein